MNKSPVSNSHRKFLAIATLIKCKLLTMPAYMKHYILALYIYIYIHTHIAGIYKHIQAVGLQVKKTCN